MSALSQLLGNAANAAVNAVVIDSALLPSPIVVPIGGGAGGKSALGPIAKPSVKILNAQGAVVYSAAPYGEPESRAPAVALLAVGLGAVCLMAYGAYRLVRR